MSYDPRRDGQPKLLRFSVELSEEHSSLSPHRAGLRIDADALHQREVYNDPAVADREAGVAVPPPRTAARRPLSFANFTAAMTSATPAHRAMRAGKRSIDPFHTLRASS